jgi:hypothetical protein
LTIRKPRTPLRGKDRQTAVELYGQCMTKGYTIQAAADFINKELGLDCEKSTYYRAYHYDPRPWENEDTLTETEEIIGDVLLADLEDDERPEDILGDIISTDIDSGASRNYLQKMIDRTAKMMAQNREERKLLNRERAIVEGYARENADKSAVVQAIIRLWNIIVRTEPEFIALNVGTGRPPIYAFGDIHWGYKSKVDQTPYNPAIAAGRLEAIFRVIGNQVTQYKFKKIYIVDLADDIEGAALRNSQLMRITDDMTIQARDYSSFMSETIRAFAKKHPDVEIVMLHINDDNHAQLRLFKTKRNELDDSLQLLVTTRIESDINMAHSYNDLLNLTYFQKSEFILEFDTSTLLISHGHRYNRTDRLLENGATRHNRHINYFLAGHWHSYSHKNKNMYQGVQESLIFAPAVTSDTDHSDHLFFSSMPGFLRLNISETGRYINSTQYLFEELENNKK